MIGGTGVQRVHVLYTPMSCADTLQYGSTRHIASFQPALYKSTNTIAPAPHLGLCTVTVHLQCILHNGDLE